MDTVHNTTIPSLTASQNGIPTDLSASHLPSIFATFKFTIYSICGAIVRTLNQANSVLDVSQDLIDTAKIHSNQLKVETSLTANDQIAQLTLKTTSLPPTDT